jgi:hypothetical protein
MSVGLISLDEASWRLQESGISGRIFAELLVKSELLLLGLRPGDELREAIDLSRVTRLRTEPQDVVVAGDVRWTSVKLNWRELCAAFDKRGHSVSWDWFSDLTPEIREQARQLRRRRLDDLRPPIGFMHAPSAVPQSARRARPEWFEVAIFTAAVPASGKPPRGKRGPKSEKRENTAASIRKDLQDKVLTVTALMAMPEKELADRYRVSRDTARKARNDVLQLSVEISASTNDK